MAGKYFQEGRYSHRGLFGRFPIDAHESPNTKRAIRTRYELPHRAGMVHQRGKINPNTNKKNRIFRDCLEHIPKSQEPSENKNLQNHKDYRKNSKSKRVDLAYSENRSRTPKLRSIHRPTRQTTQQSSPNRSEPTSTGGREQEICLAGQRSPRAVLVVESHSPAVPNTLRRSNSLHYNGRLGQRLGCHSKRQQTERNLEQKSTVVAQQSKRVVDSTGSASSSGNKLQITNNSSSNRQQIRGCIHNQRRWNEIPVSVTTYDTNTRVSSPTSNSSDSSISSRTVQSDSRQPVQISTNSRMDVVRTDDQYHLQEVGKAFDRPLRESSISCNESLCQRRCQRPNLHLCECLQQTLALQARLAVSSAVTHPPGATASRKELRNIPTRCPEMGKDFLESGTTTESTEPTIRNLETSQTLDRSPNRETPTSRGEAVFAGLEDSGWSHLTETWNARNKSLLESAWRQSSLKTYKSAWNRWRSWSKGKCPTDNPEPNDIANFIFYLHNSLRLAPRTIAVHKSVVLTFANPLNSEKLASHPVIKQLMKAVSLTRPPSRKPSTWNVSTLIEYLQHYNINVESIFQTSRHVAALLLLCSGRRIHDLTLLDISSDCYENNEDHVILWPKFGSKSDSATYRQAGWRLSNDGHTRLNPVLWIRKLIDLSQNRRSAREHLTSLFITTRGKVNAASRTVIAGWIKTLFREANIQDSPGSFRAAVSSNLWKNNVNIEEILIKGNWRSKDTFLKHYFKEVGNQDDNSNNSRTASDLFTAV